MVNNNHSLVIKLVPESIRDIELFVDSICDQLFINDTYYGNILISLNGLFNFLCENNSNSEIGITYNSDYKNINITFYNIDYQSVNTLSDRLNVDDIGKNEDLKQLFLIQSLVDTIDKNAEGNLSFTFDISALHNQIYNHRSSLLKQYFQKQKIVENVNNHND